MKLIALQKASSHLALARQAAAELIIEQGFESYEIAWSQFLSQASRFYSKLEQGTKGCPKSLPWFGAKKHQRRKDPLLSYIHHARNSDEHSIELITQRVADSLNVNFPAVKGRTVTTTFLARAAADGKIEIADLGVETGGKTYAVSSVENPKVILLRVFNTKYKVSCDPPAFHLGMPVSGEDPKTVADLAVTYLATMLSEASALPAHD